MTEHILASCSPGEVRVAVVRDGALLDYAIWRPGAPDGVGDLYRGRVTARMPALAGSFVALDGTDGFLPDSEGGKDATEGTILGVRVTRAPQGGKGPRLTARLTPEELELVGAGAAALIRRGPGALAELAGRFPQAAIEVDDAALAAGIRVPPPLEGGGKGEGCVQPQELGRGHPSPWPPPTRGGGKWRRLAVVARAFDDAVETQVDALGEAVVALPGGGRLSIHPTPALTAIDMDLGGLVAAGRTKTEHHMASNRALFPALARQIRLRNLSGAILVDLGGLPARRRAALGPAIAEALADDPLRPRFLGFTALGLAEIVRPRVHPPLQEMLAGPHAAGLAALRRLAAEIAAQPGRMPVLRASPAVVHALEEDAVARQDLARRAGRALILRADPSLPTTGWALEAA
ncbi:MAG TPA: ribonuclease E/G [Acetobacteraceae bacterium]